MSAPGGSQTYWGALDNLDDLDFSELDKSFDNTSNPTKHQERSIDLPDALRDDPLPTASQQSSFSCDPLLEHAMICFEEPLSPTQPQSQGSINSASTSSTVTVGSQTTASTSTTTLLGKRSTSDVSYRKDASSSDIRAGASILGKRAASDTSVRGPPSKIQRQGSLPPSLYEPVVVAYSKSVQNWIDSRCLPWGVQWEIARLVSSGKLNYSQIRMSTLDELQKLGSNSKAAPLVEQILLQKEGNVQRKDNQLFAKEHNAKFPYDELDLEEQHLDGDRYAALGVDERYQDWFGGKVVFRAKVENLVDDPKKPPQFKIKLERAELGASSRFTRRFGSKSFMRVKIPKYLNRYPDALMDFFRRPFIVSGKVFRAFLEKEKNVFFYMTNETPEMGQVPQGLHFEEFLNWHNPLEGNQKQSAAKYASRFALGLSTSAPGLLIAPENICFINDIVSPEGSDMTDGAGLINKTALRQLFNKFTDWDVWPTAIQCRIAGAKGMLLLHPSDNSDVPRVYIRPSMNKIQYSDVGVDPALCVIDVLRACHPRFGSKLSSETIINLAENGVPKRVFCELLDRTLDSLVASLSTWDTECDLQDLWKTLAHLGGVFAARSARQKSGMARVSGYSERDLQEDDDEDGLDDEGAEVLSTAWFDDEVSGEPSSLEETVMRMLDAGFKPQEQAVMRDKLKKILVSQITQHVANFRIDVPMSFTAFIVPDPEGVLEEGEIYFKSSHRSLVLPDGGNTDVLTGPIIVTRHPCKLPTDAQKWIAVDRPELRHYTDVIIISVRGARRGADWLGGGDYDGDKALVIYQPEVVKPFKNADPKLGDPRDDIKDGCFIRHTETITELLARSPITPGNSLATVHALQEYLIGGIKTASLVGQASNMHDYLLYTRGLGDPETIRMAHIFCHTLDGMKTGLKIKPEIWKRDCARYDKNTMNWKETEKGVAWAREDNISVERPKKLKPFILDEIKKHAKEKEQKQRKDVDMHFGSVAVLLDEDLASPWYEAQRIAARSRQLSGGDLMEQNLAKIQAHVESMWEEHRKQIASKHQKGVAFTDLSIESRQDVLRSLSRKFADGPSEELMLSKDEALRLKASYSYIYDWEHAKKKWTRFPWDVTMRELAAIKAKASGRSRTVKGEFYERFTLKRTHGK